MGAFVKGLGQALLFLGIIGLALVSVSAPLIPRIAFLRAQFANDIQLLLGSWGGCVLVKASQTCPTAKLGYAITLDNFPNKTGNGPAPLIANLTYTLLLFPIAGGIGLLAFLISLSKRNRGAHYLAVALVLLTFIASAAGLIASLILFIRAMQRIDDQFAPASPASLGPAIWITVASVICIGFAGLLMAGHGPRKAIKSDATSSTRSLRNDKYGEAHNDYYTEPSKYGSYNRAVPVIGEPQLQHHGMQLDFEHQPNEGSYYPEDDRSEYHSQYAVEEKQPQYHATSHYDDGQMRERVRSRSGSRVSRSGSTRWQ